MEKINLIQMNFTVIFSLLIYLLDKSSLIKRLKHTILGCCAITKGFNLAFYYFLI